MKYSLPILILAAALSGCGPKKADPGAEIAQLKKQRAEIDAKIHDIELKSGVKDSVKAVPVSAETVAPRPFMAYIDVQAAITGNDNVIASPQAPGTVRSVLVHTGQHVTKGQTLAVLDAAAVDQQIAAQDAQVGLLRSLYDKQKSLWAQQIGTEVQLLSAKANYEAATRQRAAIVAQRDMYRIIAPVSGTVDVVNLTVGSVASPGGITGIPIITGNKLKAEANLGESFLGKVHTGNPVTLIFGDGSDSLQTHLDFVSQSVNPTSRAFAVQVNLGANGKLHPNMSVRMKIANYENHDAIVVPVAAVQQTGEGPMVFVANTGGANSGRGVAKAVHVQTGRTADGNVEILSGLAAGDRVVTAGFEDLDNGTTISVQ